MKTLLSLLALALAGCVSTPSTPPGNDPAVYQPAHRVTYPAPR